MNSSDLTFSFDSFNKTPLFELKNFDNKLSEYKFVMGKPKLHCSNKVLDLSLPLDKQFNFFKCRTFDLSAEYSVIDIVVQRINNCGEDEFYMHCESIVDVCRRGVTVLLNKKTNQQSVVRLGLKKFFYINSDDLNEPKLIEKNLESPKMILERRVFEMTLGTLFEVVKNQSVIMVASQKLNGENIQITFNDLTKCWVVCSKNVSLFTHDFNDLAKYQDSQPHTVALRITKLWRENLLQIGEQKTAEIQSFLAKNNCTLVGEVCGNIEMRHIVHYEKESLHFYAIIPNNYERTCMNPIQSTEILASFGLQIAEIVLQKELKSKQNITEQVSLAVDEINKTSYEVIGEGVVLYFSPSNDQLSCIFLAKVKSYEYVLFRKLRETFKHLLNAVKTKKESKGGLQIEEGESELSNKEEEVEKVAKKTEKNKKKSTTKNVIDQIDGELFSGDFISTKSFNKLKEMMTTIDQYMPNLNKKSAFYYHMFLIQMTKFLHDKNGKFKIFENYSCFLRAVQYSIENCIDLTVANVDEIVAKVWKMDLEFFKIEPHIKLFPNVNKIKISQNSCSFFKEKPKHVRIILPLTILGTGKSYLLNKLADDYIRKNWTVFLISSDELSWAIIEKIKFNENQLFSKENFFQKSRKDYSELWNNSVESIFQKIGNIDNEKFVIMIDKNHHPFYFGKIRKSYEEKLTSIGFSFDFVNVFIEPLQHNPLFEVNKSVWTGLSSKILVDSFTRMRLRKENPLMKDSSDDESSRILLEFFFFFANFKPKFYNKSANALIKFYEEGSKQLNTKLSSNFDGLIESFLHIIKPKASDFSNLTSQFLQIYYSFLKENESEIMEHLFPSPEEFRKSIVMNSQAFFNEEFNSHSEEDSIKGLLYCAFFFEKESFKKILQEVFSIALKAAHNSSHQFDKKLIPELLKLSQFEIDHSKLILADFHFTCLYIQTPDDIPQKLKLWHSLCQLKDEPSFSLRSLVLLPEKYCVLLLEQDANQYTTNKYPHVSIFRTSGFEFVDSNAILDKAEQTFPNCFQIEHGKIKSFCITNPKNEDEQLELHLIGLSGISIKGVLERIYV